MDETALKHEICSVYGRTYGGSQMLSDNKNIRKCGWKALKRAKLTRKDNLYIK